MGLPAVKIYTGFSARARLGQLGLVDEETLLEVVVAGETARAQATAFDPVTAPGHDAWRYRVRRMREIYCALDWRMAFHRGLELIVSSGADICVFTRGGTQDVGLAHRGASPQPCSDIGGSAKNALGGWIQAPLSIDWLKEDFQGEVAPDSWMLLVHAGTKVVRSELSLGYEDKDDVMHWSERIILPEIGPDDLKPKKYDLPENAVSSEFDVPVVRKQG